MEERIRIMVVEDDQVVRTNLEILLKEENHELTGVVDNAADALKLFSEVRPDLIISDININGDVDGIELIKSINEIEKVPVLFITSIDEKSVFEKAKSANPYAFITKPIQRDLLERSIELAFQNAGKFADTDDQSEEDEWSEDVMLKDCFFTKIGNKLKKIKLEDIDYIEVEGKYCSVVVNNRRINVKISLKDFLQKLPEKQFLRISRNFVVNVDKIEDIDTFNYQLKLGDREIPISRTYKDDLIKRLNLI
ncbi:LytR/AlgR family response regulator transcription factor [Halocola ammonii]